MSRSNPVADIPNPAKMWFDWDSDKGCPRHYNKESKQQEFVEGEFVFLLLDQLYCVKGYNKASDAGIFSNEVKDIRTMPLDVRIFSKDGTRATNLVSGYYQDIKSAIKEAGGKFANNCYIAYKIGDELAICSIMWKGSSLSTWMEFCKKNKAGVYKKAIVITGAKKEVNGNVEYTVPTFKLKEVKKETDEAAKKLDCELQEFLKFYLEKYKPEIPPQTAVKEEEKDYVPF